MKRIITILAFLALTAGASAQLKVAILEPVDKAQNVSYGVKLLLRSSLTAAISNTPGYEGYDRVDMASIAGEQDFQRTGNVSDSQIKQLGIATGAAYVLVTEAAKYDETSIIITAKILDVETFGIKQSAVLVSGITADEMSRSCRSLAAKLLGTAPVESPAVQSTGGGQTNVQTPVVMQGSGNTEKMLLMKLADGSSVYVATNDEPKKLNYEQAKAACACKGDGWRLPTEAEMDVIYQNRNTIGRFSILWRYWSEASGKTMDMSIGTMLPTLDAVKARVRCVQTVVE